MSGKLKTSGVFKSDYELNIQKEHSHLRFLQTTLIHMDSTFKYTPQSQKISISYSYYPLTDLWRCIESWKLVVCSTWTSHWKSKSMTRISHFPELFKFILTVPLNILGKVKKSVYLILIPLILSESLKTSSVLRSDFELTIQKQHFHLRFMWTMLIHIESDFKYTQKRDKFSISQSYSFNTYIWRCLIS